jgi:histidyl-tRNA synthetase
MRDFLPAEKAQRERVLSVIRSTYRAHGFDEIETPVVEDSDRLHAGLGGDNEKLAYAVMKRGLTPDDFRAASDVLDLADLGLRFDLTVPLARFYASHRAELPPVFRAIQIAPVWRAERPQKGRFRQFIQCDIDIIGEAGPLAEIELITATADALTALGIEGATIRINDRRILRRLTAYMQVPNDAHERALIVLDKEDKIGFEGVIEELIANGLGDAQIIQQTLPGLAHVPDDGWSLLEGNYETTWLDVDAYKDLLAIRDAVGDAARLVFSPNLVRGMGYYTGTIFEVAHPDLGYSLGGGGRYDGMIGRFLGTDVPAVGFSLGFERLVELVELESDKAQDAVALIYDAEVSAARLASLKQELVATGARARLERRPKNPKQLLERLSQEGFTRFAFVTNETETLEFRPIAAQ